MCWVASFLLNHERSIVVFASARRKSCKSLHETPIANSTTTINGWKQRQENIAQIEYEKTAKVTKHDSYSTLYLQSVSTFQCWHLALVPPQYRAFLQNNEEFRKLFRSFAPQFSPPHTVAFIEHAACWETPQSRVLLSVVVTQSRMELTYVIWARDKLVSHCVTIRAALQLASERTFFALQDSLTSMYRCDRRREWNEFITIEEKAAIAHPLIMINCKFLDESGVNFFFYINISNFLDLRSRRLDVSAR